MGRGQLTEEVRQKLIAEGFEGTVTELRLMPYLLHCLMDNRLPDYNKVSKEELKLLDSWVAKRMVVSCNTSSGFTVTETFYDKMVSIIKLGYCNDVIENTIKDKTIIFEGCDSSGKTSIMLKLWSDPDLRKCDIFDRSFISDYVYAKKFNRSIYKGVPIGTYYNYWSNYYANIKNLKVVLCTADEHILYDRCKAKNDPIIKDKTDTLAMLELLADDNLFKNYTYDFCHDFSIPMLIVNTTDESLEESYKKAKRFIEEG